MITLLATIVALKLVEGTGSLEFDGFDDLLGAALACWLGGWAALSVMSLILPAPDGQSLTMRLGVTWAIEGISSMIFLLLASAVLKGFHIRRVFGLVLAAILIAGLSYGAVMLTATLGLPF